MPFTYDELHDDVDQTTEYNKTTITASYVVEADASESEAEMRADAVTYFSGTQYDGLFFSKIRVNERIGDSRWRISVEYNGRGDWYNEIANENSFEFDTSGGTQHIRSSLETRNKYGDFPAELDGVVGWDGDSVEGVDITVPVFNWRLTYSPSVLPALYGQLCMNLTGKVNSASFFGWDEGEVLFMGATAKRNGSDGWQLEWKFASSPNRLLESYNGPIYVPGIVYVAGDDIPEGSSEGDPIPCQKYGWDYLWVGYEKVDDSAAKKTIPKPLFVYVEKVYPEADLNLLFSEIA